MDLRALVAQQIGDLIIALAEAHAEIARLKAELDKPKPDGKL